MLQCEELPGRPLAVGAEDSQLGAMGKPHIPVDVECYAGHRGEQEPRRLKLDARTVEVEEVVDRWLAPEYRYFKLRGADGNIWIVRHDEATGQWELTMFERAPGARPGTV